MRTPNYRAALRRFFAFAPADDAERKTSILDRMATMPQHVAVGASWNAFSSWEGAAAAAACRVPILYIDFGSPNCTLDRLRELCPQLLDGKTVGAGHWAMLEVPEQVNAMLERFLTMILAPGFVPYVRRE